MLKKMYKKALGIMLSTTFVLGSMTGLSVLAEEEPTKIRYVAPGSEWKDQDMVLEEVNKKLQADGLNMEVELIRIPWDAWDQKTNLMLSTGEEFELIHVMQDLKPAAMLKSQNAIISLNEYLDDFPNLKEVMGNFWDDFTVNGEILAVPCASSMNVSKDYGKLYYQQELFDAAGCEIPTTIEEVKETALAMQKVYEEETGKKIYCWPHMLSSVSNWIHRTFENAPFVVESQMGMIMVDQEGNVSSYYESEEFKKASAVYKDFYESGLIHPDILTLDAEFRSTEGNNGRFLYGFDTFEYHAIEQALADNTGNTLNDTVLNPELGNFKFTGIWKGNAIPTSCQYPEKVLAFLDWLYSSEENYRLFTYGIEGVHYNKLDDNTAEFIKGEDGIELYKYDEWQMGHIAYRLFDGNMSEKCLEIDTTPMEGDITVSPVIGFIFDQTPVANQIANVQSEILTSIYPIKFGLVDYDSNIEGAIANLKAAGMDEIIAEYESQFNAFLGK